MNSITTLSLGFANAYIVRQKGTILIDTGTSADREEYLKLFKQNNIHPYSIDLIIITHGHPDHFIQLPVLKQLTHAPVLCHCLAANALQTGTYPDIVPRNATGIKMANMLKRPSHLPYQGIQPDIIIESSFDLAPFGVCGKVVPTPGHSDCSISVVLESRQAFVGDILVNSFFTGELEIAYFANNEAALFNSLRTLINEADIYYGGHGGPYSKQDALALLS